MPGRQKPPFDPNARRPPDPDEPVIPGLHPDLRWHNDFFEDPYSSPEVKARRKRERHARWIASISDRDWARLKERAELTIAGQSFGRFDDLDAPIAIAVVHPDEKMPNGERFGVLACCVLLAFRKAGG